MFKSIKKRLKDQRGLTLVELLAVVVILGIISAIAVPNIGGIIENSKRDAHIANSKQIANAAKLYVAQENIKITTTETSRTLSDLITAGVIEEIKDPSNPSETYNKTKTLITIQKVGDKTVYEVKLADESTTTLYYTTGNVDVDNLTKVNINIPAKVTPDDI